MDLTELLLRKSKLSLSSEVIKALQKNSSMLVKNWNSLIGKKEPTTELIVDSLFAIAFELSRWDKEEAIIKFIVKPEEIARELKEALTSVETFPEIDELILDELLSSTNPENYGDKVDLIEKIAERRVETFWVKNMRVKYWKPIRIASRLFKGCGEALKEYERMNRDEIIDKYVSSWWKFDSMVLELSTFDCGREESLITPAYVAYETYLDKVNRRLLEAVKKEGWKQNLSSFWSYVTRAEKPVAVFFTDALRYDLAKMLVEELGVGVEEVKVEWLFGVLPSITEVGMAALLPDAQLSLAFDNLLGGDHGFLYLRKEPERVPCKGEVVKWRFAINSSEGNFVAKTGDIGIDGDLLLAFPAGASIFAVQGGTPEFVHGGLSLQETVVPVVNLKLAKPKEKVKVSVEYPETVRLSWLSEFEEAPEEVEIKVVDYDTGEVVSKRKAKVSLLV